MTVATARKHRASLLVLVLVAAFVAVSCSDSSARQVGPGPSSTIVEPEQAATTIVESGVTTTSTKVQPVNIDRVPFQRAMAPFAFDYDAAVGPSQIYESFTSKFRGVILTMEVTDAHALPRAKDHPGALQVGGTVRVEFVGGIYTTDADRLRVDGQITEIAAIAPFGARFAMFVSPAPNGTWVVPGPTGWAFVDADGTLAPVTKYAQPNWTDGRETLASVLQQIAVKTAR